jgi:hypothetical protein
VAGSGRSCIILVEPELTGEIKQFSSGFAGSGSKPDVQHRWIIKSVTVTVTVTDYFFQSISEQFKSEEIR